MVSTFALLLLGPSTLRQTAEKNLAAFRIAIVAHDTGWFDRTLAPDYVQFVGSSKLGRAEALATMRRGLLRLPATGLTAKILRLQPETQGYRATIAFDGTLNATLQGRPAKLHARWHDEQRWNAVKGRWLLRSTKPTGFERTIE